MIQGIKRIGRTLATLVSVLAVVAFVSVVFAETPATDISQDAKSSPAEIGKDAGGHTPIGAPAEPATGELGKGTEQSMSVPDEEGGLDMKHLKVPDRFDFENARESDAMSAVSF